MQMAPYIDFPVGIAMPRRADSSGAVRIRGSNSRPLGVRRGRVRSSCVRTMFMPTRVSARVDARRAAREHAGGGQRHHCERGRGFDEAPA